MRVKTQALIAAISEDVGFEHYMIHPKSIAADQFTKFLQELSGRFEGKDFAVFMDNLSVHKTKDV